MESVNEQDKIHQICINLSVVEGTERSFNLSLATSDVTGFISGYNKLMKSLFFYSFSWA